MSNVGLANPAGETENGCSHNGRIGTHRKDESLSSKGISVSQFVILTKETKITDSDERRRDFKLLHQIFNHNDYPNFHTHIMARMVQ